jgi:hypothetical protein
MFNRNTKRFFHQYDDRISAFLRLPLKIVSVLIIRYLQKQYKSISIKNRYNQSNRVLSKLKLIQAILYYFKSQFSAYGYFHPCCIWSENDDKYFSKLFPQKEDFEELSIVVWHNPAAVTYYRNKIAELSKQCPPIYERDIKKELIKWKEWN